MVFHIYKYCTALLNIYPLIFYIGQKNLSRRVNVYKSEKYSYLLLTQRLHDVKLNYHELKAV